MRTLATFLLAASVTLTGCNTIEGAGKDVASVGQTVAKTANKAK
ncbi:hypothetical protein [Sphingomonas cannabina]|nr:hypothetical protein [Sphingomonas cannabina]